MTYRLPYIARVVFANTLSHRLGASLCSVVLYTRPSFATRRRSRLCEYSSLNERVARLIAIPLRSTTPRLVAVVTLDQPPFPVSRSRSLASASAS